MSTDLSATNASLDRGDDITVIKRIVRGRRTNLRIDPERDVDDAALIDLCSLATWAPNHKLTQPWRFATVRGDSRATLGRLTAEFQQAKGDTDEARLDKTRKKYLRSPVLLLVAAACAQDAGRRAEDRDAVACGVQNILLGATAMGLRNARPSFHTWVTGLTPLSPVLYPKRPGGTGPIAASDGP